MSVVDRSTLQAEATVIRDETTTGANTATRVGGHMKNAADSFAMNSDLATHTSSTSNPHSVTAAQVGLGSVDNTSDLNKPISTATQAALDTKLETVSTGTSITGNGAGTPLEVDDSQISIIASQVTDFDTEVSNNADVVASKKRYVAIVCGPPDQDIAAAAEVGYAPIPFPCTVTDTYCDMDDGPVGQNAIFDLNKNKGGASIMDNLIVVESGEVSSLTAATQPSFLAHSLVKGDRIYVDIDQAGSTQKGQYPTIILELTRI